MATLPQPVAGSSTEDSDVRHVLETLSDGVLFLDTDWRITFANESARRISRLEARHINGPSHWEIYPETLGGELERVYRRSMEARESLELEWYYPPFKLWMALRTLPIPSGIAVYYRDVSALKHAEILRDENARQLEQVFEVTSDAIFTLDKEYRFSFMNRRARELLAPRGDVMGQVLFEAFPGTVYQDSPYQLHYRNAMEERIPGKFEAYYPEPLNFWLSIEVLPANPGIIIFFRNITAQRQAAEQVQRERAAAERQAAEIEAVYRTAPIGLALFDVEEFRYLRLNDRQAAFFGLRPDQVVGKTLTEMAPIPGLQELFEGVRAGTPVINFPLEGELASHPGEHRYWTVNYSPVYANDGTVQAISAASLEITAQRKAEMALLQSEKLAAVGRLASSISHEINNPLEAVTNLLYIIAGDDTLRGDVKEYVELAQAEIARVTQIATQTLRFHRQTSRPVRVTAAQLIDPVLKLYRGRLLNTRVEVDADFSNDGEILCLQNEIRQVLSNLVSNALDAMRAGGRLRLRSHRVKDNVTGHSGIRITVADTGHGMSAATQARIFEPFFTTKDLNGNGLGLWISHEIIERHHGRLTLRSSDDPRWHGTAFRLFLPLGEAGIPKTGNP